MITARLPSFALIQLIILIFDEHAYCRVRLVPQSLGSWL